MASIPVDGFSHLFLHHEEIPGGGYAYKELDGA